MSGNITGYATAKPEPTKPPELLWSENILLNAAPDWVFRPEWRFHDLVLTVPQSDWVKLLDQAGYRKTIFLEIAVPDADEFGVAVKHLQDAQAAFAQGRYDDAVASCRKALENAVLVKDCPWPEEANNGKTRENMSVEDRFRLSWCAIRHVTNAAHHSNGMKAEFIRPMANYVLGATCLALSLARKQRDLFIKPNAKGAYGQ